MNDRLTFKCEACGTPVTHSDSPKDDDIVTCSGCGRVFGTYAEVRDAAIKLGKDHLNKMIDDLNLPPWITRR